MNKKPQVLMFCSLSLVNTLGDKAAYEYLKHLVYMPNRPYTPILNRSRFKIAKYRTYCSQKNKDFLLNPKDFFSCNYSFEDKIVVLKLLHHRSWSDYVLNGNIGLSKSFMTASELSEAETCNLLMNSSRYTIKTEVQ